MGEWWNKKTWVIDTRPFDGTYAIALTFVFLAYFLHPAIETAYHRVRAYRAWRAIEKRQTVEVTKYPIVAEVLSGRGRWDAARIITVLLAVFYVISWGLELQLALGHIDDGDVDLLNRPPPVVLLNDTNDTNTDSWEVMNPNDIMASDEGVVPNMAGSYEEGSARSRYHLDSKDNPVVNGDIEVASWSNDATRISESGLYYNVVDIPGVVTGLNCSEDHLLKSAKLYSYDDDKREQWGTVDECVHGPTLTSDAEASKSKISASPPTIILKRLDGVEYVIVEESSTYPSFLYSVWKPNDVGTSVKLHHQFHIASTMRLAEAVVTGIVHDGDEATGGSCFALLRQYSEEHAEYPDDVGDRASPFGEVPTEDSLVVKKLSQVENIVAGVEIDLAALSFSVWLMALTTIGFAWSFLLRSSVGMDVYNRDELMRAVYLQGAASDDAPPSAMRIFVRKEDTGNISVAISDTIEKQSGCARFLAMGTKVSESNDPAPVTAGMAHQKSVHGGAIIPAGPRTVWLEGIRTGIGRPFPGREGNFRYPTSVVLGASPVPSNAGSIAGTPLPGTPLPGAPSPAYRSKHSVTWSRKRFGERGPSQMFERYYSLDGSDSEGEDDTTEMDGRPGLQAASLASTTGTVERSVLQRLRVRGSKESEMERGSNVKEVAQHFSRKDAALRFSSNASTSTSQPSEGSPQPPSVSVAYEVPAVVSPPTDTALIITEQDTHGNGCPARGGAQEAKENDSIDVPEGMG